MPFCGITSTKGLEHSLDFEPPEAQLSLTAHRKTFFRQREGPHTVA